MLLSFVWLIRCSRRDGSPFMNLLMIAPLYDSRGTIRYYIGAQVDVSGLVKEGTDLEAYERLMEKQAAAEIEDDAPGKDEFLELSQMFNSAELETVRKHGGSMHRERADDADEASSVTWHRPRLLLKEQSGELQMPYNIGSKGIGKLEGIYQHVSCTIYLLRITFADINTKVPPSQTISFSSHPLYLSLSTRARHSSVTVHGTCRWISSCARRATRSARRGPRRDC